MLIKIKTKFTLDPSNPHGRKNLNLLLTAASIRSQIDFRQVETVKREWHVTLFLERPEFWGDDLKHLKEDINSLVIFHSGQPKPITGLVSFERLEINTVT
jgi:hypothetical protein